MIRIRHATGLALTKLRTHKLRLVISVVISGILFSCLVAASLVSRGALGSIASFYEQNHGQRFMASASQYISYSTANDAAINQAIVINKTLQASKAAEAKRLGIAYDPAADEPPYTEVDTPQGKQRTPNLYSRAMQQAMAENYAAHPPAGLQQLKAEAKTYSPHSFYMGKILPSGVHQATLKYLKDGQETYDGPGQSQSAPSGPAAIVDYWGLMSEGMLQPYIFPDASMALGSDGSIPVIAPYAQAQQLAGLPALSAAASSADKLNQLRQTRSRIHDVRFQICYRNSASMELLNQAVTQQQELAANKNNKNYVKPALLYGLPAKACESPMIMSDTRTAAEKKNADTLLQFEQKFGKPAPEQYLLTFRVVGVSPDDSSKDVSTASSLLGNVLSSSLSTDVSSWFTPLELEATQPIIKQIFTPDVATPPGTFDRYYVEFANANGARAFLEKANCDQNSADNASPGVQLPTNACGQPGKGFILHPFGGNSIALDEAQRGFTKALTLAAFTVATIAILIMIGTVSRIVADSRRETAIFRAMGANKEDIALIYLIYTFLLALFIVVFSVAVGYATARAVQHIYANGLTVQALVVFNVTDLSKQFNLCSIYLPDMLAIVGLAISTSMLSATPPLVRNLRRNPVQDMRDDS